MAWTKACWKLALAHHPSLLLHRQLLPLFRILSSVSSSWKTKMHLWTFQSRRSNQKSVNKVGNVNCTCQLNRDANTCVFSGSVYGFWWFSTAVCNLKTRLAFSAKKKKKIGQSLFSSGHCRSLCCFLGKNKYSPANIFVVEFCFCLLFFFLVRNVCTPAVKPDRYMKVFVHVIFCPSIDVWLFRCCSGPFNEES